MYTPRLEKDIRCPLEYGLTVFGGKWKSRVIYILAEKGTLRYSAIREEMTNITDAVLASTLTELITDEIIRRQRFNEIPPGSNMNLPKKDSPSSPSCKPFVNGLARIIGKITKTRCHNVKNAITTRRTNRPLSKKRNSPPRTYASKGQHA